MPTITLNRKEFENLIGKKLSIEELKDRISMLGTDLEEITEDEIIVEVFPNRPDMLSEQGFARAFSTFIGTKKGLKEYNIIKSNKKIIINNNLKDIRPFTACAIVKDLKFNDEKIKQIIQIQEKLHVTYGRNRRKIAIGIYPLEKIKFPIRFLAEDPEKIKFIPLEFNKEMTALEILKNHPTGIEYANLLKGKEKFPIFIDANNNILSMPPIINSNDTGKINEKTKDVFIECSGFDFEALKKCLNMIVTALADMGGKIYSLELEYNNKKEPTPNLEPEKMGLNLNYVNKTLGLNLKEEDVKDLLERMGYNYENSTALIPAYRADILHEIDLIEDIAIAFGYENFKPEIPNISTIAEENKINSFRRKISQILISLGFLECNTYNLTNEKNMCRKMNLNLDFIKVKSAVNIDYNILRAWVTPSLIQVLSENKQHDYPQKLFEIGTVFIEKDNEIKEYENLSVIISSNKTNFTEIKQILDVLINSLDLKYEIEELKHFSFIQGRTGRIKVKDKEIAFIGEISPEVLTNFNLETPVAALELNITELFSLLH